MYYMRLPSPRFSGEREGPAAKPWEGEGLVPGYPACSTGSSMKDGVAAA